MKHLFLLAVFSLLTLLPSAAGPADPPDLGAEMIRTGDVHLMDSPPSIALEKLNQLKAATDPPFSGATRLQRQAEEIDYLMGINRQICLQGMRLEQRVQQLEQRVYALEQRNQAQVYYMPAPAPR